MKHNLSTVVVFSFLLIIVFLTQQLQHQAFSENSLWSIGKNMPTPRTEIAATIISDYIDVLRDLEKLQKY